MVFKLKKKKIFWLLKNLAKKQLVIYIYIYWLYDRAHLQLLKVYIGYTI